MQAIKAYAIGCTKYIRLILQREWPSISLRDSRAAWRESRM